MESLANWAVSFCVVSVLCAFAAFLVPNGSVKKTANVVMTLFMLSVMVIPFSGFDFSDISDLFESSAENREEMDEYTDQLNDYLVEHGKRVTKENIAAELDGICADAYSVEVNMEINADGNPELKQIVVTVSTNDLSKTIIIKSKIGSLTGVVPEVKTE